MTKESFIHVLLKNTRATVDAARMATAATTLLLLEAEYHGAFRVAIDGLNDGRYELDAELVSSLYAACPGPLKVKLAASAAVFRLRPDRFKPIFRDAYRRQMTASERANLVSGLYYVLREHPGQAPQYRRVIMECLWSRERDVAMHGLSLAGLLNTLGCNELDFIRRSLSSKASYRRMNANNAFAWYLRRYREVSPEVLAYSCSSQVTDRIRRAYREDPDETVRTCARFALRAYNQLPREWRSGERRPLQSLSRSRNRQ